MKNYTSIVFVILVITLMSSCSNMKVIDAWKTEKSGIEEFKQKNVFVIARTNNKDVRMAFEDRIAKQLRATGIKATESYVKYPDSNAGEKLSEERVAEIKKILEDSGYNGVIVSSVKQVHRDTEKEFEGVYVKDNYISHYPAYFGGFYGYYGHPYRSGVYYDSPTSYIPTGTTTYTKTTYVLETVAYNLDAPKEENLVFVVTSSIKDPYKIDKTAKKYVAAIVKSLKD